MTISPDTNTIHDKLTRNTNKSLWRDRNSPGGGIENTTGTPSAAEGVFLRSHLLFPVPVEIITPDAPSRSLIRPGAGARSDRRRRAADVENMLGFGGAVALSEDWNATLVRHGMEKGMDRRVLSCVVCDLVMGCWCCMDLLLLVLLLTRSCGVLVIHLFLAGFFM